MKLQGSASFEKAPGEIFDRLLDPAVLKRCIPGCEKMVETAPGAYESTVRFGVGAVKGTFQTHVEVSEVVRPASYRLSIASKSPVGNVQGSARLALAEANGGTELSYDGEAKVAGLIAGVGQRLLGAAARKIAAKFFQQLAEEVDGQGK